MALPNIPLYEALKKDVSEDAARMIAEVVPQAGDVATNARLDQMQAATDARFDQMQAATDARFDQMQAATDARFDQMQAATDARFDQMQVKLDAMEARLRAYVDSRLLRYTAVILVPLSLTMLGTVGALIALVVKL